MSRSRSSKAVVVPARNLPPDKLVTNLLGDIRALILGLLNSRLLNFYFQWLNPEKGEALAEVKKEHVEKLIIKNCPANQKESIIRQESWR